MGAVVLNRGANNDDDDFFFFLFPLPSWSSSALAAGVAVAQSRKR